MYASLSCLSNFEIAQVEMFVSASAIVHGCFKDFIVRLIVFLSLSLCLSSFYTLAATETTATASINRLISYNQYGGGDVVFTVDKPSAGCHGYWITKADPGFDANMSMILAAYHSKAPVRVHGHNDQKWQGSGAFWCKLYAIEHIQ
jgi:hypothetical protein